MRNQPMILKVVYLINQSTILKNYDILIKVCSIAVYIDMYVDILF